MKAKTLQQLKALQQQRQRSGGYPEDDYRSNESVAMRTMKSDRGDFGARQALRRGVGPRGFDANIDSQGNAFVPQYVERGARLRGREVNDMDYPELSDAQIDLMDQRQRATQARYTDAGHRDDPRIGLGIGQDAGTVNYREAVIAKHGQAPNTPLARHAGDERKALIMKLYQQMAAKHPKLTNGVRVHWMNALDHVNAGQPAPLGAGSDSGDVWFNTDQFANLDEQTARFVLAKELGQANIRKFISSPEQARTYLRALGAPDNPEYLTDEFPYFTTYDNITRPGADPRGTTPGEWFGRDFAQSLGYEPTGENIKFTPDVYSALQDAGVLPRPTLSKLRRIRSIGKR